MKDYSELKSLADAATPGRIHDRLDSCGGGLKYTCSGDDGSMVLKVDHKNDEFGFVGENRVADESFFLKCTPAVVLSLISELEAMSKDAERYRWLRVNEFDIGSYHPEGDHNHESWFEHFEDQSIDRMIAEEIAFEEEAILEANNK